MARSKKTPVLRAAAAGQTDAVNAEVPVPDPPAVASDDRDDNVDAVTADDAKPGKDGANGDNRYEKERADRIAHNKAIMSALGVSTCACLHCCASGFYQHVAS